MKKILLVLVLLVSLVACSSDEGLTKVGILQLMTHDALDLSREGFIDALSDNGYVEGENLEINYQNPESDQSSLATMADSLVQEGNDIILAIGTNPALALQQSSIDTPILATAITDFKGAGLVDNEEAPEGLITGVSDGCPMDNQLDLILEIVPDLKTLGIIYTSSEPNSEIQAKQMEEVAKEKGIEVLIKTVSDKTVISETLQSFGNDIEALYVPTDNNIASAMGSVDIFATEYKIPVICGESNAVSNGGLASLGVDYYQIGYQTGEMAVKLLKGEAKISELAIGHQEKIDVFYNSKSAEKIGISLPERILNEGEDVAK